MPELIFSKVKTLFIADINYLFIYLFIYLFLFKVGLHVVKKFLTNNNDKINKQTIKFEKPLPHLV